MKKNISLILALLLGMAFTAPAQTLTITAAADLKFCLDQLVSEYQKSHPQAVIQTTYGSSGKAFTQLQQGAPYDMYFSADISYPRKLAAAGLTASEPKLYAIGRIVLWSAQEDVSRLTVADLAQPRFAKIAIANPLHAPYGQRAAEALRAAGVWDKVEPRLVLGENISQAAQFVQSGAAPVGILALALVKSPAFAGQPYALVPASLHTPLEQGVVIMKRAAQNQLAHEFITWLFSPAARRTFAFYGFTLPEDPA
jgi:molybdate transport system substrate-binding protein